VFRGGGGIAPLLSRRSTLFAAPPRPPPPAEAGSYSRLIDLMYHSTLGLRVMNKRRRRGNAANSERLSVTLSLGTPHYPDGEGGGWRVEGGRWRVEVVGCRVQGVRCRVEGV